MYLIRPPFFYRWVFSEALFRIGSDESDVYLTFDDGPHPEATPFVLDTLAEEGVEATFFLLGKNAEKHPDLLHRIIDEGHSVANHGYAHLDGWHTSTEDYVKDFQRAAQVLGEGAMRPPYGRITVAQYRALRAKGTIVLWDVLSGDFDASTGPERTVRNVADNLRNGSIIVMHDSQKALTNLRSSLKPIIRSIKEQGFAMKKIATG